MPEEELQAQLTRHMQGLQAENPGLAIAAAHELGWTVIPPEQEDL